MSHLIEASNHSIAAFNHFFDGGRTHTSNPKHLAFEVILGPVVGLGGMFDVNIICFVNMFLLERNLLQSSRRFLTKCNLKQMSGQARN